MTSSAQDDFGILLAYAFQEFVRDMHADVATQGFDDLGRSDGYLFRALDGQPTTVSDIAARLGITKQGAAQIVEDMEQRGYVQRRADPRDARARLVELTDRGTAALAAARRFHHNYEQRLIGRHGAGAIAAMRELLGEMAGTQDKGLDPRLRGLYI